MVLTKTEAIAIAGNQLLLSEILGISPQAVSKWPDDRVPELQCYRMFDRVPNLAKKLRMLRRSMAKE
jgi:hypothetical protein